MTDQGDVGGGKQPNGPDPSRRPSQNDAKGSQAPWQTDTQNSEPQGFYGAHHPSNLLMTPEAGGGFFGSTFANNAQQQHGQFSAQETGRNTNKHVASYPPVPPGRPPEYYGHAPLMGEQGPSASGAAFTSHQPRAGLGISAATNTPSYLRGALVFGSAGGLASIAGSSPTMASGQRQASGDFDAQWSSLGTTTGGQQQTSNYHHRPGSHHRGSVSSLSPIPQNNQNPPDRRDVFSGLPANIGTSTLQSSASPVAFQSSIPLTSTLGMPSVFNSANFQTKSSNQWSLHPSSLEQHPFGGAQNQVQAVAHSAVTAARSQPDAAHSQPDAALARSVDREIGELQAPHIGPVTQRASAASTQPVRSSESMPADHAHCEDIDVQTSQVDAYENTEAPEMFIGLKNRKTSNPEFLTWRREMFNGSVTSEQLSSTLNALLPLETTRTKKGRYHLVSFRSLTLSTKEITEQYEHKRATNKKKTLLKETPWLRDMMHQHLPHGVRLSDNLVGWVALCAGVPQEIAASFWPLDFDRSGLMSYPRVPFGRPFVVEFKEPDNRVFYVLMGMHVSSSNGRHNTVMLTGVGHTALVQGHVVPIDQENMNRLIVGTVGWYIRSLASAMLNPCESAQLHDGTRSRVPSQEAAISGIVDFDSGSEWQIGLRESGPCAVTPFPGGAPNAEGISRQTQANVRKRPLSAESSASRQPPAPFRGPRRTDTDMSAGSFAGPGPSNTAAPNATVEGPRRSDTAVGATLSADPGPRNAAVSNAAFEDLSRNDAAVLDTVPATVFPPLQRTNLAPILHAQASQGGLVHLQGAQAARSTLELARRASWAAYFYNSINQLLSSQSLPSSATDAEARYENIVHTLETLSDVGRRVESHAVVDSLLPPVLTDSSIADADAIVSARAAPSIMRTYERSMTTDGLTGEVNGLLVGEASTTERLTTMINDAIRRRRQP